MFEPLVPPPMPFGMGVIDAHRPAWPPPPPPRRRPVRRVGLRFYQLINRRMI